VNAAGDESSGLGGYTSPAQIEGDEVGVLNEEISETVVGNSRVATDDEGSEGGAMLSKERE